MKFFLAVTFNKHYQKNMSFKHTKISASLGKKKKMEKIGSLK